MHLMDFIDTHTHLYLPDFDADRTLVVERAIHSGINKMLLPNIDSYSIASMLDLCSKFPLHCFPMIGLHPTSVKDDYQTHLEDVSKYLSSHQFIAIGEVGIDLYWDKTYFAQQCDAFRYQVELARKHSLPLVIHSRDSFDEILEILETLYQGTQFSGVFHSFSGDADQAKRVIDMGFKIGINGVVTFKNSTLGDAVREIALEHLLLETDAPYLTPVPYRGKRNESSYIPFVAGKIAEIKGITIEEVAKVTTQTANALFKLQGL